MVFNCKICQKDCQSKLRCDACKHPYEGTFWTKNERDHNRRHNTKLVCKTCRTKGYNPDDVETYVCQHCHMSYGWKKFDKETMHNFKTHGRKKLQCTECVVRINTKTQTLREALKKSKRFCKCHCLIHKEKCPLSPCFFGEKRWPGSDGYITEQDKKFLDSLNPRPTWWTKAWGKS